MAEAFTQAWAEKRKHVLVAGGEQCEGRAKRGRGKPQAKAKPLPKGAIGQGDAKTLCPVGGDIWRGVSSGTWEAHCRPYRRISRSWAKYGHRGALILCLRYLWDAHNTLN